MWIVYFVKIEKLKFKKLPLFSKAKYCNAKYVKSLSHNQIIITIKSPCVYYSARIPIWSALGIVNSLKKENIFERLYKIL